MHSVSVGMCVYVCICKCVHVITCHFFLLLAGDKVHLPFVVYLNTALTHPHGLSLFSSLALQWEMRNCLYTFCTLSLRHTHAGANFVCLLVYIGCAWVEMPHDVIVVVVFVWQTVSMCLRVCMCVCVTLVQQVIQSVCAKDWTWLGSQSQRYSATTWQTLATSLPTTPPTPPRTLWIANLFNKYNNSIIRVALSWFNVIGNRRWGAVWNLKFFSKAENLCCGDLKLLSDWSFALACRA